MKTLRKFIASEHGLESIEYAVLTALIVASIATAVALLAGAITGQFGETQGTLEGVDGG